MTVLQPLVPLKGRVSEETVAEEPVIQEPTAIPARLEASNPTPLRLFGFAALSGAAAAAMVALVVSVFPLRNNDDPRTLQLVHDLNDLGTRVQTLTDKTRIVETEDVAAAQTTSAIDKRLTAATVEVDAVRTALVALTAQQQRSGDVIAGVNAPALFGVAVIQLRDRIEAGLPFDWELVNLRGIVGSDQALLTQLDRLAPNSGVGVVTQQRLLDAMQALLARDGPRSTLVQAAFGVVSQVLGPNLVDQPGNDPVVLTRAMARLTAGDLANFVREMHSLNAPTATAARPLVAAAQQRLVALASVQTLLSAARAGLQTQLRSVAATSLQTP